MISMKCSVRRVQSFEKCIFVLYIVLLAAKDLSYTADGLSTTNERSMYSSIKIIIINLLFSIDLIGSNFGLYWMNYSTKWSVEVYRFIDI